MPRTTEAGREDGAGILWFTIRQAASFTGSDPQTIYSWERRGHLTPSGGRPRQPWYAWRDVAALAAKRTERTAA
ncbi:hypothetical protein ABZ357_09675 [Streptomyces sp. NPDC005917]|uniref:hypothetical protein n=1 Tax=unclassified Streptomyces TaxID=2593676 RepID=UPI0033EF517C